MKYDPVLNHANIISWSERNSISRIEHDIQDFPREVNILAKLDHVCRAANVEKVHIKIIESFGVEGEDKIGRLSFPKSLGYMSAGIRLTSYEYERFLEFIRCYGLIKPACISLELRVYEESVNENFLVDKMWEGEPILKIVDFGYSFSLNKGD